MRLTIPSGLNARLVPSSGRHSWPVCRVYSQALSQPLPRNSTGAVSRGGGARERAGEKESGAEDGGNVQKKEKKTEEGKNWTYDIIIIGELMMLGSKVQPQKRRGCLPRARSLFCLRVLFPPSSSLSSLPCLVLSRTYFTFTHTLSEACFFFSSDTVLSYCLSPSTTTHFFAFRNLLSRAFSASSQVSCSRLPPVSRHGCLWPEHWRYLCHCWRRAGTLLPGRSMAV